MKKRIPSNEGKWSVFPKIITIIIMHANVTCKDAKSFHHSKYHINLDNFVSPQIKKSAQANQKHAPENPTNV